MPASTYSRNNHTIIILFLFAVWSFAAILMFFYVGSGEHDTYQMVAGINYGVNHKNIFNVCNYGEKLQFLFYVVFHYIAEQFKLNSSELLLVINICGSFLSLLIVFLMRYLFQRITDRKISYMIPILVISSPAFLFTLPYGHPFHFAFTISLIALLLVFHTIEYRKKHWIIFFFLIATVLQGLAFSIRLEQVGLFLFCCLGYLIYTERLNSKKFLVLILHTALALTFFFLLRKLILSGAIDAAEIAPKNYLNLLSHSRVKLSELAWTGGHHLVEFGLPLIGMSIFCFYKMLVNKDIKKIFGFAVSVLPPLLIYLFNPSPPRHFIITIISLSVFIATYYGSNHKINLVKFGLIILAINMLFPPLLSLTDIGRYDGERRNFTFNVVERQRRNFIQSKHALKFFKNLRNESTNNTIIIGNWIHIAQMSMILSEEPDMVVAKEENLIPGKMILRYDCPDKTFYLIESYNMKEAYDIAKLINKNQYSILTIINQSQDINDLGIYIPKQLYWWNA